MKISNKIFTICFLMLVVLSCTDDLGVSSDSIELVKVKNGYLDFKDEASFELISTQLKGKTQGELEQWENNLQGFTSLRSIFREGMHQEEIYLANGGKSVGQSQFVINHKDAFIVVNGDDLQPNLPPQENDDMLLNFVNEFGLIKIGTSIFEYTGPVSSPSSICMRQTPVTESPAIIARCIGAAPRQRGKREA